MGGGDIVMCKCVDINRGYEENNMKRWGGGGKIL